MNESGTLETTSGGWAAQGFSTVGRHRRTVALWLAVAALLVGCQSGGATPSASQIATPGPAATNSASASTSSTGASPSGAATPTPTTTPAPPTPAPTPAPTSAPTPAPTAAPAAPTAQIVFNDMMLDAAADPMAQARTFTFKSDGPGPVSVAVVKGKNGSTKLCMASDGGAFTCHSGQTPSFSALATNSHSTWTVTAISAGNATTPIVDISLSWPTNNPKMGLDHGRLQGSMSPGVPEELNGFNVTVTPRAQGNLTVSSKWTVILTYIDVVLFDATSMPWVNLDEQQYQGSGSGVQQVSYTHAVDHSRTYRLSLRDTQADNYRPDLSADISFP